MSGLLLCCAAGLLAQPPDFDAFFAEFARKRDGIVVLEAKYTQQAVTPEDVSTSVGTLLYAKPRRIVLRGGDGVTTLIDGGRMLLYEPEAEQLEIFDIDDNPQADVFFVAFDSDTESLRKRYDVSLFPVEGHPEGANGIHIKPKPEAAEDAYFLEISLYLRDEDYLPYRIHIVNAENSEVVIEVEDYVTNGRPHPATTQLTLPEGTRIIQDNKVIETVGANGKRIPDAIRFDMPPEAPVSEGTGQPADSSASTANEEAPEAPDETARGGDEGHSQ